MRPESFRGLARPGRPLALPLIIMRTITYISKTLSDSVLGVALLTLPLSLPQPAIHDVNEIASFEGSYEPVQRETALGRFLQSEIEQRIERVSGKSFEPSLRRQMSRDIAMAVAEASYINDVDPFLLLSMIEVESRYNKAAVGLHGEKGLMQIKPSTALWVAPEKDELYACNLHEIRCNIMMGASYVGFLQRKVEKRRARAEDPEQLAELATPKLFRQHVLRSYNLGPAKANRIADERGPAMENPENETIPYATKIGRKADRMRSRYLALAMNL